ncbi:MAG: heat-inducible transcriptional repressor HrcA [Eubacteriales bacterium]
MEISDRKLAILKIIIDGYITTGMPIGSRTVSKKPGFNFSSATIRNEMADLEELGFLEQPYTSAGRIPSDKAYRLYVNKLMNTVKLTKEEKESIKGYFAMRQNQIDDVVESAADIISDTTKHISMVLAPQLDNIIIRNIQLVRISETKALLLIISSTGLVRESVISIPPDIDEGYLTMLSNMMTQNTYNMTLCEARNYIENHLNEEIKLHIKFLRDAISCIEKRENEKSIVLSGAENIFKNFDFQDFDRAKSLMRVLETKDILYDMLKKATKMEFCISIGQENEADQLKDVSIVTATYKIGGKPLGSFGVIGPTRMDYAKVISVLNHIGGSLNSILSSFIEEDK